MESQSRLNTRSGQERGGLNEEASVPSPRRPKDRLHALMRRPLTRRGFLGLLGAAGLGAYVGSHAWGIPDDFFVRTVESPQPTFDPRTYRLVVDGLVQRPLSLTYRHLLSLPSVSQSCDFLCIEGWSVEDVPWEGVQLCNLMSIVRPLASARFVTFHCLGDVYQESLTLEQSDLPLALLAHRMYGHPLPPERGSPLRLVFPRMLGYKGAKWVTRVEFRAERDLGYWERFGAPVNPWVEDEQPCRDRGWCRTTYSPVSAFPKTFVVEPDKGWLTVDSVRRVEAPGDGTEATLVFVGAVKAIRAGQFDYRLTVADSEGTTYEDSGGILLGNRQEGEIPSFQTSVALPADATLTRLGIWLSGAQAPEVSYIIDLPVAGIPAVPP